MITGVWVLLAGCAGGGLYGADRILARDDMPLARERVIDMVDGMCGLVSLASAIVRRLVRGRPGRMPGAHRA